MVPSLMKDGVLAADKTVAQVLQKYPEVTRAFIAFRMNCVGCYLMQFCTLQYAARSYHREPESLLEELEKAIQGATKTV